MAVKSLVRIRARAVYAYFAALRLRVLAAVHLGVIVCGLQIVCAPTAQAIAMNKITADSLAGRISTRSMEFRIASLAPGLILWT